MDKFVVDSMNGKLAKKLRFFGFNTLTRGISFESSNFSRGVWYKVSRIHS